MRRATYILVLIIAAVGCAPAFSMPVLCDAAEITSIQYCPKTHVIILGTDKGVYSLAEDGAAEPELIGLRDIRITVVKTWRSDESRLIVGSEFHGLIEMRRSGAGWKVKQMPLKQRSIRDLVFNTRKPGTIYLVGRDGFFFSSNDGKKWKKRNWGLRSLGYLRAIRFKLDKYSGTPEVFDPAQRQFKSVFWFKEKPERIFIGGFAGLGFFSDDEGLNWKIGKHWVSYGLKRPKKRDDPPLCVRARPPFQGGVFWRLFTSIPGNYVEANEVRIDAPDLEGATAYLSSIAPGLRKLTVTEHRNWVLHFLGLGSERITALELLPSQPASILAASKRGLFRTDDKGAEWTQILTLGAAKDE